MVNSQGSAVGKEVDEEDSVMFRRIWKKFKGSHPEDDSEGADEFKESRQYDVKSGSLTVNLHGETFEKSSSDEGDVSPRGICHLKPEDLVPSENNGNKDDGSISSSDSSSSSDSFCSVDEGIVVPTHRIGGLASSRGGRNQASPAAVDSPSNAAVPHFDLELLARTHFPDFEFESVPDGELTESSDDDSTLRKKEEKYKTKEDQDVAVFMDLAKRLNIKSLLHLLQGHVRANNPPMDYLRKYNDALDTSTSTQHPGVVKMKPLAKQKQFRWAEVTDEKVRAVVHEVASIKSHKALWWTPKEMQTIRAELIDVVQFFRKRRPEYIRSIEIVARQQENESVIDEHLKLLAADTFPRGLETHIVKMLSDHRRSTIRAVLDEQQECRNCNDNEETTMHCIREQSLAYSQLSTKFASCLAKCDEIDALKASMSRWRVTPANGTNEFFT